MDNAPSFLRWWKAQRDSDSALYPHPTTLTKTRHAKAYTATLTELNARWPGARKGVLSLLIPAKNELSATVRAAANDAAEWWKTSVSPVLIKRSIKLAREIRLHPSHMDRIMRNPSERDGAYGSYSKEFFDCFATDGGERLLGNRTSLRAGLEKWFVDCIRWYESIARTPLVSPPMLLNQWPSPHWGESSGIGMACLARSPVREIAVLGDFATPTGREVHDSQHWHDPRFVGSRPIYECILGYVAHWLGKDRPASLARAAGAASVNAWSIANAFDKLMTVTDWQNSIDASDWLAQVETAFDAWIRTSMGSALEFKQAPGAPPNTGSYIPAPQAALLWAEAFPFRRPERPPDQARATLCAFMLDAILDYALEQNTVETLTFQGVSSRRIGSGSLEEESSRQPVASLNIRINSDSSSGRTRWAVSVNGDTRTLSVGPCNALLELSDKGDTTTDERHVNQVKKAFPMLQAYFDTPGPRQGRRTVRSFTATAIRGKVSISDSDRSLLNKTFIRASKAAESREKRPFPIGVTSMHKSPNAKNPATGARPASQASRKPL